MFPKQNLKVNNFVTPFKHSVVAPERELKQILNRNALNINLEESFKIQLSDQHQ